MTGIARCWRGLNLDKAASGNDALPMALKLREKTYDIGDVIGMGIALER